MNGIAVATKSGDTNPAVLKLFQPGFRLSAILNEVVERAMPIIRIAAGADLHGFQAEGGDFIQHGVEGEMVVNGIEHADRDFAQVAAWLCRRSAGNWILGICRACQHLTAGNRSRQQATRGSQKLPPADGGVLRLLLHASPRRAQ